MKVKFTKMHGAGNDFIMIDDRALEFPLENRSGLAAIGARHTGVGCDGIILVQPSQTADFRMRFFNPDGGEVEMCGNGARCVARFARDIGAAGDQMAFDTVAGLLRADVRAGEVTINLTEPKDWRMDQSLMVDGVEHRYNFVNSGVPHVVIEVDDLQALDLQRLGAAIRYHEDFAPAGTNANFIRITGPDSLELRTYERGVEGETLACGTGMAACALTAGRAGKVTAPVKVTCAFGDVLTIGYDMGDEGASNVTLTGGAEYVFEGQFEI
jgi:diaminopimelate epimerase